MLQAANTDLFNPLVSKDHNSECQNLLFPLQIKPVKVNLKLIYAFLFFAPRHKWVKIHLFHCRLLAAMAR